MSFFVCNIKTELRSSQCQTRILIEIESEKVIAPLVPSLLSIVFFTSSEPRNLEHLQVQSEWEARYLPSMSAKSIQGPGGKKPASAATNLIGELGFEHWNGWQLLQ